MALEGDKTMVRLKRSFSPNWNLLSKVYVIVVRNANWQRFSRLPLRSGLLSLVQSTRATAHRYEQKWER